MISGVSDSKLLSAREAASWATKRLGMAFEPQDINALVRLNLVTAFMQDEDMYVSSSALADFAALVDWHPYEPGTLSLLGAERGWLPSSNPKDGWIDLKVAPDLSLSVPIAEYQSFTCQIFVSEFRRTFAARQESPTRIPVIVPAGMVRFVSVDELLAQRAAELWTKISMRADGATDLERSVTLSLYGVKTRILPFVTSVIDTIASNDAVVCDLMSGSGIVSRKIALSHEVFSNDANSYGPILARALVQGLDTMDLAALVTRLKDNMGKNARALEHLFGSFLAKEFELLNTERTAHTLRSYLEFSEELPSAYDELERPSNGIALHELRQMILERRKNPRTFPFILATSYWANVHYGLRQAVLLDSLRYAIELEHESVRDVLLAALLQAALISASGPHFAQPFRPKALPQFKALADKRLRRIDAEFFRALSQLALLQPSKKRIVEATKKNWREALSDFRASLKGRIGVVYVDPPYTAVQYSRYYHVLNVLADYDYPICAGPGRCPVKEYRFSSRFEFKAGPAKREFHALVHECSASGLQLVLSYSKSGAITIDEIVSAVQQHYGDVRVFQTGLKHHAQGKASSGGKLDTLEFMIAGGTPKNML